MDQFEEWNARFPRGVGAPHRCPLANESVFLFEQVTTPRPAASYFGIWHWYQDAAQLKAHLMFVVMPDMAAMWLGEGATVLNTMRQPLSTTLAGANEEWRDDLEFFQELAAQLDAVSGNTNQEVAHSLEKVTAAFTDRFGRTPTWDLGLTVISNTLAAGTFLYERNVDPVGTGTSKSEWLDLCRRAGPDKQASSRVAAAFEAADEF